MSRWSLAAVAPSVAGVRITPDVSVLAVLLIPVTLRVFVTFVDSAKNSALYRSRSGNRREYRAFSSNIAGARNVLRPTYSGLWKAVPSDESPLRNWLLP